MVVRELPERHALVACDEPLIFNCTGLGARVLMGDDELIPAKGQVTFLPQPEIDYITLPPMALARVLEGHRQFFSGMK